MTNPDHHVYWITKPGREGNPPAEVLSARSLGFPVHIITDRQVRLLGKRGTVCVDADLQDDFAVRLALEATKIAGCKVVAVPVVGEAEGSGLDPKLLALLTAGFDAAVVLKELADDCPDTQGRDWAMHRHGPLVAAMAAVIEDIAAQHGISAEQVMEEIKSGSTIRDAPDFLEDPEESPFAEPTRWLSGGPPSGNTAWWINLGDGEGFDIYDSEAERDAAANTLISEARDEAREFGEWPVGEVDTIHSWSMGTLTVTHRVEPTGAVIEGTEVVDYTWTREDEP